MPAGVSWGEYLKFMSCAMVFMLAGSQTVHYFFKPLEDLNDLVEAELEKRRKSINNSNSTNFKASQ